MHYAFLESSKNYYGTSVNTWVWMIVIVYLVQLYPKIHCKVQAPKKL